VRTVLSYLPEGLARMLETLRQDVEDLKRKAPAAVIDVPETDEDALRASLTAPLLLCLAASGDSIASGGDYVTFDSVVTDFGFSGAAGASWTHPVAGVYVLTYEHSWDTYTGNAVVGVEIDGAMIPEGTLADGNTGGASGRGTVCYVAEAGTVGRIKVTQSSGSAQTCDALVRVAITDPLVTSDSYSNLSGPVYSLGTQAAPDVGAWTAGGAAWTDTSAHWIWTVDSTSRPSGEQAWFVGLYDSPTAKAVTISVSVDNTGTLYLNGTELGPLGSYDVETTYEAYLSVGQNQLAAVAQNTGSGTSPAGFILSMVETSSGTVLLHTSDDGTWTGDTSEPAGWPSP
jgi:hypothetical protein